MNISVDHISKSTPCNRRPGIPLNPTSITLHSTGNEDSTARNERDNLERRDNEREASFHYVIDENSIIECIPPTEVAWHAGDGYNGKGNRTSISVEMCESGDREKVIQRTKEFVVYLMKKHNIRVIKRHYDWTKKNCPRILNNDGKWTEWIAFLTDVFNQHDRPITKGKGVGELALKVGDKGDGVRLVHQQLFALGYIQKADRDRVVYDSWTAGKVKQFQDDQKIKATDGVYDYITALAFTQVLAVYHKHWLKTKK